jgi:hypothetical protein
MKTTNKSYWEWTFKKKSFWIISCVHFGLGLLGEFLSPEKLYLINVVRALVITIFLWSFIFLIVYYIYQRGYGKGSKKS